MRVFPELTVDGEFQQLGSLGHTGALNDRQKYYLESLGYSGSLTDMFHQFRNQVILSGPNFSFTGEQNGLVDKDGNVVSISDVLVDNTSDSLRTMFNSSGNICWNPHNLVLNSASPATQSVTVESGVDYTVGITGSGSVTLSGAGTGTVTQGSRVEVTASTITLTLTVSGSVSTMWMYRSDLGGMINNPDTGTDYVPTTSSAVYLSRFGDYVYNGSSWINGGITVISEARTNSILDSRDLSTLNWFSFSLDGTATRNATGLDGQANTATTIEDTGTISAALFIQSVTIPNNNDPSVGSIVVKKDATASMPVVLSMSVLGGTTEITHAMSLDLSTGAVVALPGGATSDDVFVQDFGDWWRIGIKVTNNSTGNTSASLGIIPMSDNGAVVVDFAQVEVDAQYMGPIIPTDSSSVTVSGDNSVQMAFDTLDYNSDHMWFVVEGYINHADINSSNTSQILAWVQSANEDIVMRISTGSTVVGRVDLISDSDTGFRANSTSPTFLTTDYTQKFKFAFKIGTNELELASGGLILDLDSAAGTPPAITTATLQLVSLGFMTITNFQMKGEDISTTDLAILSV